MFAAVGRKHFVEITVLFGTLLVAITWHTHRLRSVSAITIRHAIERIEYGSCRGRQV